MKKDIILLSTVIGVSATTLEIIVSYMMKITKLIKTPLYLYVGKLAVGGIPHKQWIETTVGIFGHLLNGTIFTFVFILLLRKWGDDYIYLKGLGFGGFLWLIHEVIIPNVITSKVTLKLSATSQILHIVDGLFWGLAAAFLYRFINHRIKAV